MLPFRVSIIKFKLFRALVIAKREQCQEKEKNQERNLAAQLHEGVSNAAWQSDPLRRGCRVASKLRRSVPSLQVLCVCVFWVGFRAGAVCDEGMKAVAH